MKVFAFIDSQKTDFDIKTLCDGNHSGLRSGLLT